MVEVVKSYLLQKTPVVGCEVVPVVIVQVNNMRSYDDIPESSPVEGHFLRYKWYRVKNTLNSHPVCFIHPTKIAKATCQCCVSANVPVSATYYCSKKCCMDAWRQHAAVHACAAKEAIERGLQILTDAASTSAAPPPAPTTSQPVSQWRGGERWVEVGYSRTYTPVFADIGSILRLEIYVVNAERHTSVRVRNPATSHPVIPPPCLIPRMMVYVSSQSGPWISNAVLKVLSYNILADSKANNGSFRYCPPWALTWQYRRRMLLQEIVQYRADVVCLQEVQNNHFDDFFSPELDRHGYGAVYMRKSTEVYGEAAATIDGCATFFRREKFSEVAKYEVEFNKAARALSNALSPRVDGQSSLERLIQDNIELVVILEAKLDDDQGNGTLLCVANTQVSMHETLKDVKLWQVQTLVKGLEKVAHSKNIPIILCGDFGSVPQSAPHTFLVKGNVTRMHPDLMQDPIGIFRHDGRVRNVSHRIPLQSVYSRRVAFEASPDYTGKQTVDPQTEEPFVTYFKRHNMRTIDYMFFSADKLIVSSVLELPDGNSLRRDAALPSAEWSSSHIALMAGFNFKLSDQTDQTDQTPQITS